MKLSDSSYLHTTQILQYLTPTSSLNCSVKLADVSTRCSSHPHGKSEVRCEKGGALIGVATALACPCGWVQRVEHRHN